MFSSRTLVVGALIAGLAGQTPLSGQSREDGTRSPGEASDFSLNLGRIRDALRAELSTPTSGRLRLDVYVDVYGRPEANAILEQIDFARGALPSGAPTHADLIDEMTPRNFRVRGGDGRATLKWIVDWFRGRR